MELTIDCDQLREDLEGFYGTGACSGMPAMLTEVFDIQEMSDEEIIQKAVDLGFDLFKYEI